MILSCTHEGVRYKMQLQVQAALSCPQLCHTAVVLSSDDLQDSIPQCCLCSPGSGPHGNDASFPRHFSHAGSPAEHWGCPAQLSQLQKAVLEHFRQLRDVSPLQFHLLLPGDSLGGGRGRMGRCLHWASCLGDGCASCYSAWRWHQSLGIGVRAAGCGETGKMKLIMTLQRCRFLNRKLLRGRAWPSCVSQS